jgi:hypothetical protein|tara:strand:+ start:176 stop:379 length:204 start_codon:yes stop_codon:yes gene_type:complete
MLDAQLANLREKENKKKRQKASDDQITSFVVEAIKGFVRSIVLGYGKDVTHVLQVCIDRIDRISIEE